jgi:hypothetical protein
VPGLDLGQVQVRQFPGAEPIRLPSAAEPAPDGERHLGGVVDRLATLGGSGRRAAQRLLEKQGSLALADARRADVAAERQARGDARRAWLEALAPGIVYTLAIGFAAGGQVTGIAARLEPEGIPAILAAVAAGLGAAGLIEGNGLAFAILARRAALAGRRAYAARTMMYLSTAAACALNVWGHWDTIWVYPCALGSIVALVLWVVETAHRCADQLAAAKTAIRRQAAIKALATTAIRRSHGRRIAGIVAATLDSATLETLAVTAVNPATVAETAIGRYVAGQDKTARARHWWTPWRRSTSPLAARHVTATVTATGGGELAELEPDDDGYWRDLEADLAISSTASGGDPDGSLAADTAAVAVATGGVSGDDLWRYSRPLAAVPDTTTGGAGGGELAAASTATPRRRRTPRIRHTTPRKTATRAASAAATGRRSVAEITALIEQALTASGGATNAALATATGLPKRTVERYAPDVRKALAS